MSLKKIVLLLSLLLLITGCGHYDIKRSGFYVDNIFEINVKAKKDKKSDKKIQLGLESVLTKVMSIDANLNKLSALSELSALNSVGGERSVEVSAETYNLVKKAVNGSILTDGYFDISWKKLIDLFSNNNFPSIGTIEEAKNSIGYLNIIIDKNFNRLKLGNVDVKLDLDRIKRGYIIDLIAQELKNNGINKGYIKSNNLKYNFGRKRERIKLGDHLKSVKVNLKDRAVIVLDATTDEYLKGADVWAKYLPVDVTKEKIQKILVVAPNALTAEVLANAFFFMGTEKSFTVLRDMKKNSADSSLYEAYFVVLNDKGEPKLISMPRK